MYIDLFIIINFLGVFFTAMIIAFKNIDEEKDETQDMAGGWKGISFICVIISLVIWISLAAISINLSTPYVYESGGEILTYDVVYPDTWPLGFMYAAISIIEFVLVIYLFPETWRKRPNE